MEEGKRFQAANAGFLVCPTEEFHSRSRVSLLDLKMFLK